MKEKRLILFWLSFYSLFGAWKIVGMTVTCNPCDVMNINFIKVNNIHDITPITRNCHANNLGYCFRTLAVILFQNLFYFIFYFCFLRITYVKD